jgi:hypothetical protein
MNPQDKDFYPDNYKECEICGICSFAHRHKAGTKPNEYEVIEEPTPPQELQEKEIRLELIEQACPGAKDYIEGLIKERDAKLIERMGKCLTESITVRDEVCMPWSKYSELLNIINYNK